MIPENTEAAKTETRITFTVDIDGEQCIRYVVLDMAEDDDIWNAVAEYGDGLYDAIEDQAILTIEAEDDPHAYSCIPW
ncbi:MAG: hypothetical protein WC096_00620 [Sphaerochaetaceae bacterium]